MALLLKAHAIGPCLIIGAAVSVLALVFAGQKVVLPQLLMTGAANVDVVLLLSAAYAPLTVRCFGGDALRMEATASRSLASADAILLAALLAPVGALAAVGLVSNDAAFALDVVRDFAVFAAASLLLLTLAEPIAAATVPVVYMLVISLAGVRGDGSSPWWAALRQPANELTAGLAICLVLGALVTFHRWARQRANAGTQLAEGA